MSIQTLNYINGEWITARNGEIIESINPANWNEVVGTIQSSCEEDVDAAVLAAKNAFKTWSKMSSVNRGQLLEKAANLLEKRADEIAETATKEMGKMIAETKGEVLRGAAILRYYAQEGLRTNGEVLPSASDDKFIFTKRVPLGVVGVIAPWNFPIAIPIWKMAPALVYGNTIVFKPAAETGVTAAKIVEVFADAGLPSGVLNLVNGRGSVVGNRLVDHEEVAAITFTGSNAVGRQVAAKAVARGAKYQLELGGKNPAIVLDDADLDLAANLTVAGAMKQSGQRCTATSRVYVHEKVYESFKNILVKKVCELKVGSGLDEKVQMGPVASKQQFDTIKHYIEKGKVEGASLLVGGGVPKGAEFEQGYYLEPTVFEQVTHEMTIAREEIFGPVLCLIKVKNYEEAIQKANDTVYGLSAAIFTKNLGKTFQFIDDIEAGLIQINGETGGAEPQAPFGGMKESSSHSREQGQAAKEFFTTIKTVTVLPIQ
ncbi:alpha-ketoglutaric semialdehyde dehydrogenase GucD [Bacillus sp. FJAT-47783]|uniref:alpha-ketoglutaric semialdehyde dehydrogenase GucD n=1 Tax=Bacillus sp. FJAT-47783 TaxID=2922712 RepID=UPI001FADC15C|nr:alpha-ketoglutaric semialdehyde dehydrogenase GucD [Bacillus sp. FJAT-47783]